MSKRMRIIVVVAIITCFLVPITQMNPVHGLMCVTPGNALEEIAKYDAVFSGTVTDYSLNLGNYGSFLRVSIDTTWKGTENKAILLHYLDNNTTIKVGERYLFYANKSFDYKTGICYFPTLYSKSSADIALLGTGHAPTKSPTILSYLTTTYVSLFLIVFSIVMVAGMYVYKNVFHVRKRMPLDIKNKK